MKKVDNKSLQISKEEYEKTKLEFKREIENIQKTIKEDISKHKAKEKNL